MLSRTILGTSNIPNPLRLWLLWLSIRISALSWLSSNRIYFSFEISQATPIFPLPRNRNCLHCNYILYSFLYGCDDLCVCVCIFLGSVPVCVQELLMKEEDCADPPASLKCNVKKKSTRFLGCSSGRCEIIWLDPRGCEECSTERHWSSFGSVSFSAIFVMDWIFRLGIDMD